MSGTTKTISLLLAGFIGLAFVLFVINQTAQVVILAGTLHPAFGQVLLWSLLLLYALLLLTPLVLWLRMPRALTPPSSEQEPAFSAYLELLKARLARNPYLKGRSLRDRTEIESALGELDREANKVVSETASALFLTTAISQNGHLDALLVLSAQTRMIWRVAHIYQQRPSVQNFVRLYANVGATAFVAGQLNDIDVTEQLEPVIASTLGSVVGVVPGMQAVSLLLVNSMLSGSANAFLTLRVGMITKRYCNALVQPDRRLIRRAAVAEAAQLLGTIVASGSAHVARSILKAGRSAVTRRASGMTQSIREAAASVADRFRPGAPKPTAAEVIDSPVVDLRALMLEEWIAVETDPTIRARLAELLSGRSRAPLP